MLEAITRLHQDLRQRGTIVGFTGTVSQGIDEDVCEALELYVAKNRMETNLSSQLFSIFIEISQNIRKYFRSKSGNPAVFNHIRDTGTIVVGRNGNDYYVSAVNLIETRDRSALEARLQSLKSLSPEQARAAFRESLLDERHPGDPTDLGFLFLAKLTRGRIEFRFDPCDRDFTFFYLEAVIEGQTGAHHE
jgi:hypothetical protein